MSGHAASLAGALWLRPGAARPHNLRSTRPDWVGRVSRGLPASRLPTTLGSLFSLCSHAHVSCAGMAVQAARHDAVADIPAVQNTLAQQTLRDHLRHMWLVWPLRLLPAEAPDGPAADAAAAALASCPALLRAPGSTVSWLETHALGMPAAQWLAAWRHAPAAWLAQWCRDAPGVPAQVLRTFRDVAHAALPQLPPLQVHANAISMRGWAARLALGGTAFARQPLWRGDCADTGVWSRVHDKTAPRLDTPWLRLGARLAETVRLALATDADSPLDTFALDAGALSLGDGAAVAWVEMARGLLIHHVQLDGRDDAARVAACHVVAPTEWNFHPDGSVARVLAQRTDPSAPQPPRRLAVVLAAYDPCVSCEFESTMPHEVDHA
jgi:hypothetical protein